MGISCPPHTLICLFFSTFFVFAEIGLTLPNIIISFFISVCGGQLTATKGNIASPTTSGVYSPSENCTWIIKQVPGSVVKLSFSKFGLERSANCTKDYVLVRNGQTLDSPVIGRFCGGDIPSNYVSTGPTVLVQFVSDGETGGIGFEATYERVVHGEFGLFFVHFLLMGVRALKSNVFMSVYF